MKKIIGEMTR